MIVLKLPVILPWGVYQVMINAHIYLDIVTGCLETSFPGYYSLYAYGTITNKQRSIADRQFLSITPFFAHQVMINIQR